MTPRRIHLPAARWLPRYRKEWWRGDLWAGLTVGIMLIPQGMAYAMIAGLPPVYGLYGALVPQLVYAVTGTSRQVAVGPVAMDSLLVAAALGSLGLATEGQYIVAAIFLALIVGAIQFSLGLLRLGFIVNFLSRPVVSGFTSAAAIIIGVSQFKHVLGVEVANDARLQVMAYETFAALPQSNGYALLIGGGTIGLLLFIKRYGRGIPAALIVVALGTLCVFLTGWDDFGLPIVGAVPQGLPAFSIPGIRTGLLPTLAPLAITIALVGYLETISIARALAEKDPDTELDANQELVALGLTNVIGSTFASYVSTASFSRSAVNAETGAHTQLAAVVSASVIAVTLLVLTPLFYYLPEAVLGAIILAAVFKLVDVRYFLSLWHTARVEAALLAITFALTLTVGMVAGLLTGIFASLAYTVYRASTPHIAEIARVRGTDYFRNVLRFRDDVEVRPDVLMFRFDAPLFYGNVDYFRERLQERIDARGEALRIVVLNSESISYVDSTAEFALVRLIERLQERGLRVIISGALGPMREVVLRGRIGELVGEEHMFVRSSEVMDHLDGRCTPTPMQRRIALEGRAPARPDQN